MFGLQKHTAEDRGDERADPIGQGSGVRTGDVDAPAPNSDAKPDSPGDLTKRSWFYVARKTVREFSDDQCSRQLQAGLAAEEAIQLPPRDTTKSEKASKKQQQDIDRGRALRLSHGEQENRDHSDRVDTPPGRN